MTADEMFERAGYLEKRKVKYGVEYSGYPYSIIVQFPGGEKLVENAMIKFLDSGGACSAHVYEIRAVAKLLEEMEADNRE